MISVTPRRVRSLSIMKNGYVFGKSVDIDGVNKSKFLHCKGSQALTSCPDSEMDAKNRRHSEK